MVLAIAVLLWPLVRKAMIRSSGIAGVDDDIQLRGGDE
jgi:hypothetical protein